MIADPLTEIAGVIERNLWPMVANNPPDRMALRDICLIAAQLEISRAATLRDGCSRQHAEAFVLQVDNVHEAIDRYLEFHRIRGTTLEVVFDRAAKFARDLLDVIALIPE